MLSTSLATDPITHLRKHAASTTSRSHNIRPYYTGKSSRIGIHLHRQSILTQINFSYITRHPSTAGARKQPPPKLIFNSISPCLGARWVVILFLGRHEHMSIHPSQSTHNRPKKLCYSLSKLVGLPGYVQYYSERLLTGAWRTQRQLCHQKAHSSMGYESPKLFTRNISNKATQLTGESSSPATMTGIQPWGSGLGSRVNFNSFWRFTNL